MKKILLYFILFSLAFQHEEINGQTTIVMKKEGGVYTVPCSVNGLKLRFVFDTGASDVTISLTEANFMLKNGYLNPSDIRGKQYFSDAKGTISVGTKITIRKIEFSGLILDNIEATVVHEKDAPLLLGQSAMAKLGKFQFDPQTGTLTILNEKRGNIVPYKNNPKPSTKSNKSIIRIVHLDVNTSDLGAMNWYEAQKVCTSLGNGWRLPTEDELIMIYENKDKFDKYWTGFPYWSATETKERTVRLVEFGKGVLSSSTKSNPWYFWAVKSTNLDITPPIYPHPIIAIGDLDVMKNSFGRMTWDNANRACENLGSNWRLPTKDELQILYNEKEFLGFLSTTYWSGTKKTLSYGNFIDSECCAWYQSFDSGEQSGSGKIGEYLFIPVRSR